MTDIIGVTPGTTSPLAKSVRVPARQCDAKCKNCWYCDLLIGSMRHDHDHAPVPFRNGGTGVVTVCLSCHEMKDRCPLIYWNPTAQDEGIRGIILAGIFPTGEEIEFPSVWDDLNRYERLMWAKLAMLAQDIINDDEAEPWHVVTREEYLAAAMAGNL